MSELMRASDADRERAVSVLRDDVRRVPARWARRTWSEVIDGIHGGEHREPAT